MVGKGIAGDIGHLVLLVVFQAQHCGSWRHCHITGRAIKIVAADRDDTRACVGFCQFYAPAIEVIIGDIDVAIAAKAHLDILIDGLQGIACEVTSCFICTNSGAEKAGR